MQWAGELPELVCPRSHPVFRQFYRFARADALTRTWSCDRNHVGGVILKSPCHARTRSDPDHCWAVTNYTKWYVEQYDSISGEDAMMAGA